MNKMYQNNKYLTVIEDVRARKILDSRGNFTIEVEMITKAGFGRCAAPSGASTGKYEVLAFPEGGVDKSIVEIEETIAPELIGMYAAEQEVIDGIIKEVDGTDNFSNIGGNAAVALSLANAKAAASSHGLYLYQYIGGTFSRELPYPLGNVIGGGAHASNSTDIQEFLVLPVGAENITQALNVNSLVHKKAKELLIAKGCKPLGKGDEGAWAASIDDRGALEVLSKACEEVYKETGIEVRLGIDVAASELWNSKKKKYVYATEGKERSREEQIEYMINLAEEYNLYYIEDPLEENDFEGFAEITKNVNALVCGDDLYVTNVKRLRKGLEKQATNAILIKPNQCGTLTDTFKAVSLARSKELTPVFSHRSGETTDETIAHLAVGFRCPIIKTGVVGGERIAKLNELIRIEEMFEQKAKMSQLPRR